MKTSSFLSWFKRRRRRTRAGAGLARGAQRPHSFRPLLEKLEDRLTPSGSSTDLVARLTSPVAASYLSTSDVILVDVIGQLSETTPYTLGVDRIVGELQQTQRDLDKLLADVNGEGSDSATLRGELNQLSTELNTLAGNNNSQGDLPIKLETTTGSVNLSKVLIDLSKAIDS